jgi:F-type H+/Na+-transporting ATPase subunit alpha
VDRIKECQAKLEDYLTTRKESVLEKVRNEKAISDTIEAELKAALEDFKASWK